MGPKCDRIFIGLSVFFTLTTLAAVGVLCWREFFVHRLDKQLTKDNLIRLYPSIFHIYSTQYNLENLVVQGCNTFTKVNQTFDDGNKCSFSCSKGSTNGGRRKRATSNDVYHACCVSNVNFISPDYMHNIIVVQRELVHLTPYRQIFKNDNCSHAVGCTGCTCMHQMELVTAVVYKPGYNKDTANNMDHVEIDFFYLPGCCKCINVQNT